MKIFGYEIRRNKPEAEQRSVTVGPSTSLGLPWGGLNANLSAETAMKLSAVYRCVDVISDSVASMPWDIMVFNREKEWVRDEFHFSARMLNNEPNPSMSKYDFMKAMMGQVLLNGNTYIEIKRDEQGNPIELILLNGGITMYVKDNWTTYYEYLPAYGDKPRLIPGEDVLHIKNFSYDGLLGVSTLTHAANITSLSASADGQAKGYYANGVNMNGIVSVPGKIGADKATQLKTDWSTSVAYSSTTGVGGGVVVLEGGATYTPIQVNPRDAQMLETRTFNVVDICRFFGVHPSKAFDTSSNGYGAVESYQLGYITDTLTPHKIRIENEFNRKLYRPSQRAKTKLILDVKELLSADLDTLGNYYTKMFQVGGYTVNEIRRERRMPLVEDGDKAYVQVNLAELGAKPTPDQNKNTDVVKPDDKEDEDNG